jgi:glycosyltransferase involved in cell wall biosynthesis
MKIAIDCRALRKPPSGIPNFLATAINGLAVQNPDLRIYLLTNEEFHDEFKNKFSWSNNINIIIRPLLVLNNISFLWLLFKTRSILKEIKPDLFWAPGFLLPPFIPQEIKTLVTVHDMVFKEHKETMSRVNRLFFQLLHDKSLNKADLLWSNSYYTKQGIYKYFPVRRCQEIFVGFFINRTLFKQVSISGGERDNLFSKLGIRRKDKLLLFVGTLEPRKNLKFLLSLMPVLASQGYTLLVVGAKGWGRSDIKDIIDSQGFPHNHVIFAGYLTSDELVKLYNLASMYVSSSLNEGFGMPQLEAMACGCPVVSPYNSAMIEVVDGAGKTVKTWDHQDWVDTINLVYNNRAKYINAGFKRIQEYEISFVINNLINYINRHM